MDAILLWTTTNWKSPLHLGLRLDSSNHHHQINFCCLLARYYIWNCKKKETAPRIEGFLKYLKSVYDIEVKTGAEVPKKWEILKSFNFLKGALLYLPCKKYTSLSCQCVTSLANFAT